MNAIIDQQTASAIGTIATLPRQTANPSEIARNFPLRIASIILPERGNDGESLEHVHEYLQRLILDTFGGYSGSIVHGAWRDEETGRVYHDTSRRYDIAMEDHGLHYLWLEDTARTIGAVAHQLAIAITYPNGAFRIVPTCDE